MIACADDRARYNVAHMATATKELQRAHFDPAHIEVCFPTVHDPSLAPEGKHIMTIDVNSQPYHLRDERWDDIKESRADRAIAQMSEHFPKLPDLIDERLASLGA